MSPATQAVEATYYRTALLLGLVRGEAVHRWADDAIAREAVPHAALIAVASTPADDLSGLRHALWPLVIEPDPPESIQSILGVVGADLAPGRRTMDDTVTVLRQLRSMVKLPRPLYDELSAALVEQVHEHQGGDAIRRWLAQHADATLPSGPSPSIGTGNSVT